MTARATEVFHIPSLDGIRALAFSLVFVAHAGLDRIVPGGFGVTVFFFLSGYLITTLLRVEYDKHATISLRQFYLRRAFRILPPFYLVLGLAVVAAAIGLIAGGFRTIAVTAQMLHFANYWSVAHGGDGMPAGTGVYWSLAVEEHFYLVFPCLYLVLRHLERRRQAVVLWSLCAAVLAWRCGLVAMGAATDRTYLASDTRIDSILFGCALAVWGNPMLDGPSHISDAWWKRALLPGALALLLVSFVFRDPRFRETFRYSIQGIALYPVFIVAMRFPTWGLFRLLNNRVAAFIGVLSYSLYLVHHVILLGFRSVLVDRPIACAAAALGASIAVAWAIHLLVEKPSARLRKRLARVLAEREAVSVGVLGGEQA
jgi:peptidoglycan/LPS O-acetylase OafA/YrhL